MFQCAVSVLRDGIVDLQRPRVDTARDIGNVIKSVLCEKAGDLRAASARMTKYCDGLRGIEFCQSRRYLGHRNVCRPLDPRNIDLPCFSDVKQGPKFAGFTSSHEFRWRHVFDQSQASPSKMPQNGKWFQAVSARKPDSLLKTKRPVACLRLAKVVHLFRTGSLLSSHFHRFE